MSNQDNRYIQEHPSMRANMLWNSFGSLSRLACNWLITVLVVRLSNGFDAAGLLSLCMSISNLLAPFADCRLYTIQLTDVKGERTTGEYVALRLITVNACLILGLAYSLITCSLDAVPAVMLYLLFWLTQTFFEVMHALNQRMLHMDYNGISYFLQGVSSLTAFSLLLYNTNSLELAIAGMAVSVLLVGVLYDIPHSSRFDSLWPVFNWEDIPKTLSSVIPLAVAQSASSAVLAVPRQYLAAALGTAALGIYSSVVSPVVVVQMGATYIYSPLMGEIAKRLHGNKRDALPLLTKTVLGMVLVCSVFAVLLLLFGGYILSFIFGSEIVAYVNLLWLAVVYTFITAFSWFMNDVLLSLRDFKASLIGNISSAVAMLLLHHPIIDRFGMNGVSIVGILSYSVGVLVLSLFFVRDYRRL